MDKAKVSSKRKTGGRAAPRRLAVTLDAPVPPAARRGITVPEELYVWREPGDPPGAVRQGTARELGERQAAGAAPTSVNKFGGGMTVIEPYPAAPSDPGRFELVAELARKHVAAIREIALAGGGGARRDNSSSCAWREHGDPAGMLRTGTRQALQARQQAGVVAETFDGVSGDRAGSGKAAAGDMALARALPRIALEGATAEAKRPEGEAADGTASVRVRADLLRAARERTGFGSDAEVVEYALSLLDRTDPATEFFRASLGSVPGFGLDD